MLTCSIFLKWLCLFCYSNLLFFVAFNKIVKRFFCMWIASFFFVFLLLFVYLHSYARTAIKIFCVCIQIFFEKQNCKTMLTFIFMNAKSRSFIFYSHIYLNPNVSCRTFRKWINRIKLKHQYSWTNYFCQRLYLFKCIEIYFESNYYYQKHICCLFYIFN